MEREYLPLENYGVIGNLNTVALISNHGSIDYLCLPRFDSPTAFGALLDKEKGGYFCIQPELDDLSFKQLYLTDTAILVTRFFADEGIAELTDFMAVNPHSDTLVLIRKLVAIRGRLDFRVQCRPRFNYGRNGHTACKDQNGFVTFEDTEKDSLHLFSDIDLKVNGNDVDQTFTMNEGDTVCFVLQNKVREEDVKRQFHDYCMNCYRLTFNYWKEWVNQCTFTGRWVETVRRSSITLKLLTSAQHGSMIASPTFGLPENIAGRRNWDYRYAWIRDTAFTMFVFLRLGFMDDAMAFMNWVQNHCIAADMHLMYTVDGNAPKDEHELKHFEGYRGAKPVLVGNDAYHQRQLDIYGELIDTIYLYNKYGGQITYAFWQMLCKQIEHVCKNWQQPDHGLWEVRGEEREFLHSRLMCWVALDRAIKIAEHRSFPYPRERWQQIRDDIYMNIYNDFWNEEKQAYVQYKHADQVDASVLLMPLVRYVTPTDPRWLKTLAAIECDLKLDVLIYRYKNNKVNVDGLAGEEGTFTMCSFWYAECLAKSGEVDKANEVFAKILGYSNPLRLFSEQLSKRGEQLGNFPQAFTHLALISAALALNKAGDKPAMD
jgi:GH15 family glucan-1,4-alpha-glucosidase